jgi:hypothetical protein
MPIMTKEMWERMEPHERRRIENMVTLPVVDTTAIQRTSHPLAALLDAASNITIGTAGEPVEHAGIMSRFSLNVMAMEECPRDRAFLSDGKTTVALALREET